MNKVAWSSGSDNTFHFACEQPPMTIVLCYFDTNTFLVDIVIDGIQRVPKHTRNKIKSHLLEKPIYQY